MIPCIVIIPKPPTEISTEKYRRKYKKCKVIPAVTVPKRLRSVKHYRNIHHTEKI